MSWVSWMNFFGKIKKKKKGVKLDLDFVVESLRGRCGLVLECESQRENGKEKEKEKVYWMQTLVVRAR